MTMSLLSRGWLATSALDRLDGIRSTLSRPGGLGTGALLALGAVLILFAVLAALVTRRRLRARRAWQRFRQLAESNGLCEEELALLSRIARKVHLKDPSTILTSEPAFEKGLARLLFCSKVAGILGRPEQQICGRCVFLFSLRQKLGFRIPVQQTPSQYATLGLIDRGHVVQVVRQSAPHEFAARVVERNPEFPCLVVEPEKQFRVTPGESWVVRHSEEGILSEFPASVVEQSGNHVVIKPIGQLRRINRRRFVRVPTDRPAHLARFAFHKKKAAKQVPRFAPARLIEFAGPGIQLEVPRTSRFREAENVLVVLDIGPDKAFEGVGRIHRVLPGYKGKKVLAIEFVGLSDSEIAELARQTNALQREKGTEKEDPVDAFASEITVGAR